MNQQPNNPLPGAADEPRPASRGEPVVDLGAVLAAMQDQLDDLTATVAAQQRTIDELVAARDRQPGSQQPGRLQHRGREQDPGHGPGPGR